MWNLPRRPGSRRLRQGGDGDGMGDVTEGQGDNMMIGRANPRRFGGAKTSWGYVVAIPDVIYAAA